MERKKKIWIQTVLLTSSVFAIGYYLISNYFLAGFMAVFSIIIQYFIRQSRQHWQKKKRAIENAYQFCNLMNTSMTCNTSIYEAYCQIENYLPIEWVNFSPETFNDSLLELADQTKLNGFTFYLQALNLFDQAGGNFKQMMDFPTKMILKEKNNYDMLCQKKTKKIAEVTVLYLLFLLAMLFLRFFLANYYLLFLQKELGKFIVLAVLICGLVTYFFCVRLFYHNQIRGI